MSYNPENQYRCTIIRGKSQSDIEDLLPFYVQTIHEYCPCQKKDFDVECNNALSKYIFHVNEFKSLPDANKKTVRNHITEIMGKLLGLYYTQNDENGEIVYESESCSFLFVKNDFPAFFKNICLNFQFPNFSDKKETLKERMANKINLRPMCFIVSFLNYARHQKNNNLITKQEIGYYILNNLDVLQGKVSVDEIYSTIMSDRKNNIIRNKLSGSHDWQHIKEQLNLMELSNIIETDRDYIWLNASEWKAINLFCKKNKAPLFDFYSKDLYSPEKIKKTEVEWQRFYSKLNPEIKGISTDFTNNFSDIPPAKREKGAVGISTIELGDKGESFVYKKERDRIKKYKERLVNKVLLLGKTKGLGYDISSIEADENLNNPEFTRYIEVKSTTRISEPSFDSIWSDSVNLTAKEWIAAEQHKEYYNIYRVYFTKTKTIVIKINNPYGKAINKEIDVYPTTYRMDFDAKSIKTEYEENCK